MTDNIFTQFPDCIESRMRLKGLLADFFPNEKLKINLILGAYDEGIVYDISQAAELDVMAFGRWKKIMIDNYGVNDTNAEWVIDYWFAEYGVKICGKVYQKPKAETKEAPKAPATNNQPKPKAQKPTGQEGFVDVSKMADDDKIPKSMVEIITDVGYGNTISSFTCTLRKDFTSDDITYIKFAGEYTAKTSQYVLIMVMLYNANDELIGYDSNQEIDKDHDGKGTYSNSISIPTDEFISRAVVRLTIDPVWA